jgi:hypothetical protein
LKRAAALALAAAAALAPVAACRQSSVAAPADVKMEGEARPQPSARPQAPQPPPQPSQLREDPVEGAKATAQWRAHLAEEERERKLRYDRDRMKDHRAVLRFLVTTRARLDRAASPAAVAAIRAKLPPALAAVRRRVTGIDKWGVNSNLLQDYDAMLKSLEATYPDDKVDFAAREKRIKDWLAEAAETEDE